METSFSDLKKEHWNRTYLFHIIFLSREEIVHSLLQYKTLTMKKKVCKNMVSKLGTAQRKIPILGSRLWENEIDKKSILRLGKIDKKSISTDQCLKDYGKTIKVKNAKNHKNTDRICSIKSKPS